MNKTNQSSVRAVAQDDAILPITKAVAVAVIPFLAAAFLILYVWPEETSRLFAWEIVSPLTTALMGAGYLGGTYFFARLLTDRHWHRFGHGLPGVAVFTAIMLVATLLHWETFDPGHWPFWVWLVIYIVTPVLVPVVWWLNRQRDSGQPEPGDVALPPATAPVMITAGIVLLGSAVVFFMRPQLAIAMWPWPLTLLTARVLAGWQSLLGVGALALARDSRWSAWRIPIQSILIWQTLLVLAFIWRRDAFVPAGFLNWYTVYTVAVTIAVTTFYGRMESLRSKQL